MLKKLKLYLLSGLLFAAAFSLLFALVEVVLRSWVLRGASESRNHVQATETLPITFKPDYEGIIWEIPFRTNRYGFRDEEDFPQEPESGELRVLSLGDSIGFGLGVEAERHYTKVAQRLLQPRHEPGRLRIINAGGTGTSPSSYAVFLRETGAALQPDAVVIEIELNNDVTDEALLRRVFGPDDKMMPSAVRGGRYVVGWDGNLLATCSYGPFLLERTYLWTDLTRRALNLLYRLSPNEPFRSQPYQTYYNLGFDRKLLTPGRISQGWTHMFNSLEGTKWFLSSRGIPFLILVMPSRYIYDEAAPQRAAFARDLVDQAIKRCRLRRLPCLDMTQTIGEAGGKDLFFDFAHLTSLGNQAVGDRLSVELARMLKLSRPSEESPERPDAPNR